MENNMLMTEEQLREQNRMLVALVGDLATILDEVLTALPPEFHELPNVRKSMSLTRNINSMLRMMPSPAPAGGVDVEAPVEYMSGRWKKRNGDIYGIVRQPGVRLTGVPHAEGCKSLFTKDESDCDCRKPLDADNPPGDLRPAD